MADPTRDDIDALVGPATPHFAYQLRARVRELVSELPDGNDVRRYAEEQMDRLLTIVAGTQKAREQITKLAVLATQVASLDDRIDSWVAAGGDPGVLPV